MVDLPESSSWHPLLAARAYEARAEESAGIVVNAYTAYPRLREEFRERELRRDPSQSSNALDTAFGLTGEAKKCVSDLNMHVRLAGMYAAMATMKHTRYVAEQEHRKQKASAADPE